MPSIKYPVKETVKKQSDYFLLSNLPMTETVEQLYEGYINARVTDAIFGKNHVLEGSFYKCY